MDTNPVPAPLPQLPQPLRWLVTGAVRHSIVGFGAVLVSQHLLSGTQQTAFDNWGTDTVLVIAGLAWSFLTHKSEAAQKDTDPGPSSDG